MRRKSERNKAKAASPEKETERATRKSSRRRAKRQTSESPDSPKPIAITEEPEPTASTTSDTKGTPEALKVTKEPRKEEEESVVWTVSREDASPGEIQKLKLSRQPNSGSEGSSEGGWSCRKLKKAAAAEATDKQQGDKWRESGVAEEADYCRQATIGEAMPSSSVPGQDSNEEVSDSKEILPETTTTTCSADLLLSDDKPNIDDDVVVEEEEVEEDLVDERKRGAEARLSSPMEVTAKREETTSSDEEEESSQDERKRNSRRKHRSKYNTEEDSETNSESEKEARINNSEEGKAGSEQQRKDKEEEEEEEKVMEEERITVNDEKEKESVEIEKTEEEKSEAQEEQKTQVDLDEKQEEAQQQQTAERNCRPVKVNLKRSFSVRVQMEKIEEEASLERDNNTANKENLDNGEDPRSVPRKRRWGTALSTDSAPSFSISTDSLKALVPGARPLSITEVRLSKDDDEFRATEKWVSGEQNEKSADESGKNGASKFDNHIAARRKISIVKETASHVKSPSPPATKPTNILLIKNLVRPFTLNQIKELLSRTGSIVENGFWMDRIKSKCFVEYANEDQAFETRQALHGISWPISNPKRLHVEYATKDDMELALELSKDQSIPRKTEPLVPSESWQQDWNRDERTSTKVLVVREWDLGKEDGQQHPKEKEKKEHDKKRRQRSRSPAVEPHLPAPARKFKKKEDEPPPAKLLDDLFRKTKATPCIYWLPLTNEQIVVKEEMRRQHMAEHARRLEEMRRAERNNRDGRRRRSPRK